ncbi:MAG: hypothetical protein GX040_06175 [Alcaligenaceae bacterium]|nr:hypothetical protein [Alcaligenaceae bacterium]
MRLDGSDESKNIEDRRGNRTGMGGGMFGGGRGGGGGGKKFGLESGNIAQCDTFASTR